MKKCAYFRLFLVFSFLLWNLDPSLLSAEPISPAAPQPIVKELPQPKSIKPLVLGGDCGPKVLQKIFSKLGEEIPLESLIAQTKTQRGQTTLDGLIQGTKMQGLWALGIKTDSNTLEDLLKQGYHVVAHVGGNKHYVWVQEINKKWAKGYNPAVRNESWKLPRKVFDSMWKGEGMIVWMPRSIDVQQMFLGRVLPLGLESKIEILPPWRMSKIRGGEICQNSNSNGGTEKRGAKTHEPVELSNGDLVMATKDFAMEALGPDLVFERSYHAQLFSDIEGWQPEPGTGSWSVENGKYAGAGDRTGTVDTWANLSVTLSMQTIAPGSEDFHTAWVNFRYQNEDNRYYFLIKTTGVIELTKFKNGTQSFLASQSTSYDPTDPHTIQIEANGSQIKVWVDSNLEINYTDSDPLTGAGKVVLESYYSHSHYDSIQIAPLPSGTTQTWNFSTDDNDSMFGRGWRANIEMNLIFKDNDDILVRQGNDRRDLFIWNSGTGTWTSPTGIYQSLTKVSTEYDLKDKHGTTYHFDAQGYLETVTDRYGNTLTFTYTTVAGKKRVSEITEETGRSLEFTYNTTTGRCTQVTDLLNRTVNFTYNTDGLLESAEDPRGNVRQYEYDEHYRMTQYIDRNSNVFQYEYAYNNRVISQTDPENNVTTFEYLWDVTQVTDAAENVWTYEFENGKGTLISQTDPEGNTTTYDWDDNYNLLSKVDPEDHQTQYTYDSKGNRLTETDALGKTTTWTYESTFNQVTSVTDKRGNTTNFTYDSNGNLTEVEDPLGFTITATYNSQGQVTSSTDKRNKTTEYSYDTHGYLDEVEDPLNNITDYDYDDGGRLTQMTDVLTHTTEYEYDENDNLIQVTDPLTHTTSYAYDNNDNKTEITDGLSHTTEMIYNAYDKVETVTDPLNRVTTFTYDKSHFMLTGKVDLVQIEDPDQNLTEYTRDKIGRLTALENALNDITTYEYNGVSKVTQITDANNHTTEYEYDDVNRLIKTTHADSSEEENIYDANGNLIEKILRDGKSISYNYNERNELILKRLNNNDGLVLNGSSWTVGGSSYVWDDLDLSLAIKTTSPGSQDWHTGWIKFRYQNSSNYYYFLLKQSGIVELTKFKGGTQYFLVQEQTGFTPDSVLTVRIQANGSQIKIWLNNELQINYTDSDPVLADGNIILEAHDSTAYYDNIQVKDLDTGTINVWYPSIVDTYEYDENGNLTQITRNADKIWTFTYDDLNRLTETTDSEDRTIQYEYDDLGRRTSMTYPDTTEITYTYDNANRLTQINEGSTTHVAYTYDNANRRTLRELANNVDTTYTYDNANQLTSLATVISSTTLSSYAYTYDDLGNRTQQVDLTGTHTFQYDDISQLTQANYPGSIQQNYAYDPVHNRDTFSQSVTGTYTNNNINQVTQYLQGTTTTTYSWDDRGNIEQKLTPTTTTTYSHNLFNQLTQVAQTGQDTVSFEYDPLGRRIQKTVASTTVKYTWSGDQLIEVRNNSGTLLRKFIYGTGIDEPVALKASSSSYYYTHDGLGSISEITSSTGTKVEYYDYDVYGKPTLFNSSGTQISSSTVDNPYYFTGREYDFETGLYYYRARYYDPNLGRFLQTDPLGYVDSLNLYAYVVNNPWNRVDPTGEFIPLIGFIAVGIGVGIAAGAVALAGFLGNLISDLFEDPETESERAHRVFGANRDSFTRGQTRSEEITDQYFIVIIPPGDGPPTRIQEVNREEAIQASRTGSNVQASTKQAALDVTINVGPGRPIDDVIPHKPGGLPHFHPTDINGNRLIPNRHIFYSV